MKARKIFVNLPVKDLQRSKAFFEKLGFTYDAQFTDDKAACMIINEEAYVMLLTEPFFQTFTQKPIADAKTMSEGLFCLSCDSRAEVDHLVKTALESGGSRAMAPQEHAFMYGWSFYDPDGHHWEVVWMEKPPAAA
jgi:predicted lactoylglutathione lyase